MCQIKEDLNRNKAMLEAILKEQKELKVGAGDSRSCAKGWGAAGPDYRGHALSAAAACVP